MRGDPFGTVAGLFRYPVKSMRGESLARASIEAHGLPGDRAFALRDGSSGRILSAKRTAALLGLRATLPDGPGAAAVVELPDGRRLRTDAPDAAALLSAVLGQRIELCGPDDVRADRHVEWDDDNTFDAPPGAFVDLAPLHLLATASLRAMAGERPESRFDARRFRPNLLVDTPGHDGYSEDGLDGRVLAVGATVRLRVLMPTIRCALTTRAQEELPADPAILRTIVERHGGNLGAYATVEAGGEVRVGDAVVIVDE